MFSDSSTVETLEAACTAVGLESRGAELLRLGEHAIYRLREQPVVVRIARSVAHLPDVEKELAVARWLASIGYPAVRAVESVDQPLSIDGRVVSFWMFIPGSSNAATVTDLAALLRKLHALPRPEHVPLSRLRPFDRVERRLTTATGIQDEDRGFLWARFRQLQEQYAQLTFSAPSSVIHGDASIGNVIRHTDGRVVLFDLDGFAIGPREWDLTLTATYYRNLRWHSREEYEAFVGAYGLDVTRFSGFPVLAAIRELHMVSWLSQNVRESPRIAAEFHKRVQSLRADVLPRNWEPY